MTRRFKTVSGVQQELKLSLIRAVEDRLMQICIDVVKNHIQKNVYEAYIPQGDYAYDRTFDLYNAVTLTNMVMGTKYLTFDVQMDSDKINPQIREGDSWNAHASVEGMDVSEYIPLWIEEGTSGSLWDREGAHYMESAYVDLSGGKLAQELVVALRRQGWEVKRIS